MKKEKIDFSSRITLLTFILSIGIVYQHTRWNYVGSGLINDLYKMFFFIIETFVPLFFMISGYLFFRTYSKEKVKSKLLSRVRTLLIPYIIWNVLYAVFTITLFKLGLITNINMPDDIGKIIIKIINSEFSPLWFVKYLMFFVIISPAIYYILKNRLLGLFLIILSLLLNIFFYYSGIMNLPINVNSNNIVMINYQIIYYLMGAYAAIHYKKDVENSEKYNKLSILIICLLLIFYMIFIGFLGKGSVIINHIYRLVFSITLWFVSSRLPAISIKKWMKNSFFIYCSHMMLLQCTQRVFDILLVKIDVDLPLIYIAEYFLLPIIIVVFIIILAELLKKYMPHFSNILMGNRG